MIGLPSKDGEEKPQFDNEKLLYRALLEPAFFNSDIIPLPRADTIVKREKRRREAAKSTYADFKNKHLWVKKATGLGVTELCDLRRIPSPITIRHNMFVHIASVISQR